MADATAGVLTPETMVKLTTASATGRLLLGLVASWFNGEAAPAMAAVNADLRGLSDRKAGAVRRALERQGDPDVLADAMVTVLAALGQVEGLTAADWRRVRALAGDWLAGERPAR